MEVQEYSSRVAFLLGNDRYHSDAYQDLPHMGLDLLSVRRGLRAIGFTDAEITELKNEKNKDLHEKLKTECFGKLERLA